MGMCLTHTIILMYLKIRAFRAPSAFDGASQSMFYSINCLNMMLYSLHTHVYINNNKYLQTKLILNLNINH
jgi:hypothetical protein